MTKSRMRVAIVEAKRFISAAELALNNFASVEVDQLYASKESATARRASMDLTRALSNLRRSL